MPKQTNQERRKRMLRERAAQSNREADLEEAQMFQLVVGEMDAILGAMDDSRDFAEIVMDLWIAGRESDEVESGFDKLAQQLLEAKKQHVEVQNLDESLFAQDFEV